MKFAHRIFLATGLLACGLARSAAPGITGPAQLSTAPINMAGTGVKPNIMLLLDDSGSMAWDYMPDFIGPQTPSTATTPGVGIDKPRCGGGGGRGGGTCGSYVTTGLPADPPYYDYQFNFVYYNPNTSYQPAYTATGSLMTSYTANNSASWTAVPVDGFGTTSGTINLLTGYPEAVFCNSASASPTSASCKRNGIDTGTTTSQPFFYNLVPPANGALPNGYPDAYAPSTTTSGTATVSYFGTDTLAVLPGSYEYPATRTGAPYYYTITPTEYCQDALLQTCAATAASFANPVAAPVRYCLRPADANASGVVSGSIKVTVQGPTGAVSQSLPRCQAEYNIAQGYYYPRFGMFTRYDILPAYASFTRGATRTDCAGIQKGTSNTCTYAEEMTNFANWYAYYHTRMQWMKTAVGLAFTQITNSYRVGFVTINAFGNNGLQSSNLFLPLNDFTTTQKSNFYSGFYALSPSGGTPLRQALSYVGQYYAGLASTGMIGGTKNYPDPVQYSCQSNFAIMTTDGYWNGNPGMDLAGNPIADGTPAGEQDGNPSTTTVPGVFEQRVNNEYGTGGFFDGNLPDYTVGSTKNSQGGSVTYTDQGTLADVAMYYYATNLRPPGSKNATTGTVVGLPSPVDPTVSGYVSTVKNQDLNPFIHMVTFTVGLGVSGNLIYDSSTQDKNPSQLSPDFLAIVNGTTGGGTTSGGTSGVCAWDPGVTCNWPQVPNTTGYNDDPAKTDDLWHAAINGRGSYLSAKNSRQLLSGLTQDLAAIQAKVGAAAASAVSTPNITPVNNQIFSTTFSTAIWGGDMTSQEIDTTTGLLLPCSKTNPCWDAATQLLTLVNLPNAPANTDNRKIMTPSGGVLVDFLTSLQEPAGLTLDAKAIGYFTGTCVYLSQCSSLAAADQAIVNTPENLIGWLRGQQLYSDNQHFRSYTATTASNPNGSTLNVLGDLVDSRPTVVNIPTHNYADAAPGKQTYAQFIAAETARESVVYVGGNDGMLHAFDAGSGNEIWAFIPRAMQPYLYLLSDTAYATNHRFYVDGSPETGDMLDPVSGQWRTLLIGGYNNGGEGYYALDVTNPSNPIFLWEFCGTAALCGSTSGNPNTTYDANLGMTYGNPLLVKRAYDGQWVVLLTSGYNNASGQGILYELDPISGAIQQQVSTGVGTPTTPSGLARVTARVNNPYTDDTATTVYGGDLLGNLWRFNLTGSSITASLMATLVDATGLPQPVTTRPEVASVNNTTVVYVGTGRLLGNQDLQAPSTLTPAEGWSYVGSLYGLADTGANLGNPRTQSTIVKQTLSTVGTTQVTVSSNPVSLPTNVGWYVDFLNSGERVNVDPQLVLGTLLVTTNIPTQSACSSGGNSFLYQFNYLTGSYVPGTQGGIVGTETQNALTVGNVVVELPNQTFKVISTDSDGAKNTSALNVSATASTLRHVGWHALPQQ